MHGPASDAVGDPGDVPVLPVVRVGVPFHRVRVVIAARVGVDIVGHVRQRAHGLLEFSASVAVPFSDGRIVHLIVG